MRAKLDLRLVLLVGLLPACLPKESKPVACTDDQQCAAIQPGLRCDTVRQVCTCVGTSLPCGSSSDGGARDAVRSLVDALTADAPATSEGPPLDAAPVDAVDQPMDGAPDQPIATVDTRVPDAAGTCAADSDCLDPARAFCVGGLCVGCQLAGAAACAAPVAVCDLVSGLCVGCTDDRHCPAAATPICDQSKRACVACTTDAQCGGKDPGLPACRADGQCVECTAAAVAACRGTRPACDTQASTCVECLAHANCGPAAPLCGSDRKCHGCATDGDCVGLGDANRAACAVAGACVQCTGTQAKACAGPTPACNPTSNRCVACVSDATCSGTAPICATATNTCRACASASECAGFAGHSACAASGACVECTDNRTCSGGKPICQITVGGAAPANACRACAADDECAAVGPGVCMRDGHCATDSETIYVGPAGTASCASTNPGTAPSPVCTLAAGVGLAKSGGKPLVVVRGALAPASTTIAVNSPLTILGKDGTILIPSDPGADCLTFTQGELFLRNLAIQGSLSPASGMGINVAPPAGATALLHMETCAVRNNPGGGILLNGAAFELRDVLVTGNGPGTVLATGLTWGGIYVQSLPASGPASFELVTVQNNNGGGLTCSGPVTASGLLASLNSNTVSQIGGLCAVTAGACSAASPTCGAQRQPQ